jgi:hypothetical protein
MVPVPVQKFSRWNLIRKQPIYLVLLRSFWVKSTFPVLRFVGRPTYRYHVNSTLHRRLVLEWNWISDTSTRNYSNTISIIWFKLLNSVLKADFHYSFSSLGVLSRISFMGNASVPRNALSNNSKSIVKPNIPIPVFKPRYWWYLNGQKNDFIRTVDYSSPHSTQAYSKGV